MGIKGVKTWDSLLGSGVLADGTAGQFLKTNGLGVLAWGTVPPPAADTLHTAYVAGSTINTGTGSGNSVIIAGTQSLQISATLGLDMTDKKITTTTVNQRLFLAPTGSGALVAESTTSTVGDARGVNAVDLQLSRSNVSQVAGGSYATLGGGQNNSAFGDHVTVSGGLGNQANTAYATIGGGQNNLANGNTSTIAGGTGNSASAAFTAIGGGTANTASFAHATVGGGQSNNASNDHATASGGWTNTASGNRSSVGGGFGNTASNTSATVGGGESNTASFAYATVGGGFGNTASNTSATVGGGQSNLASGQHSSVAGGQGNTASNVFATVSGGRENTASSFYATVSGGRENAASSFYASVGGGQFNVASATSATVGGGEYNTASVSLSTIPGGKYNNAAATGVIAMGHGAWANVAMDLVIGNNSAVASLPTTDANVHFRIDGNTSDVHIGRLANQSAVALASNKLLFHTILPSFQSRAISLKAPDTLAASYGLILPAAQGAASTVLTNDGTGTLSWATDGGGAGEINAVLNPSIATDLTGWTNGPTVYTNAKDEANSPLAPVTSTSLSISSTGAFTAGTETNGTPVGSYYTITTVPTGLRNKKLKLEFYCTTPASTNTWSVSVWSGATRMALSTDSSSISSLPAGITGKYTTYFDADASTSYTVRFTKTAGTTASTLYVTSVIVGPGIQPQGAVVQSPQALATTYDGLGTTTLNEATYARYGSRIKAQGRVLAGTTAASVAAIVLPSGLTLATGSSGLSNNASGIQVGVAKRITSGTAEDQVPAVFALFYDGTTANKLFISERTASSAFVKRNGSDLLSTGDTFVFDFDVPVAEFAGSGTVNLAQNDVEHLTNTSVATGTSDTTAFGYGPAGVNIVAVALPTLTIKKRVRAQRPMGASQGAPILKVSPDGILWLPAETVFPYMESGSDFYGMRIVAGGTAATDMDVEFGGDGANGVDPWSTFTSWKWRVVLEQPGVAVGFGIADTLSSGLVPSGTYNKSTGAWTLGPSSTASASGQPHVIHGGLNAGATGTGATDKRLIFNVNGYTGQTATVARNNAGGTLGGAVLQMLARGGDTDSAFIFSASLIADGNTTASANIAQATQAGAWTLGPVNTATAHTMQGDRVNINPGSVNGADMGVVFQNSSDVQGFIGAAGGNDSSFLGHTLDTATSGGDLVVATKGFGRNIRFYTGSGVITQTGLVSGAGAWTLGDTANAAFPGNLIVGRKDGSTIPAGYVGQVLQATLSGSHSLSTGASSIGNLAFTAGVWIYVVQVYGTAASTVVMGGVFTSASSNSSSRIEAVQGEHSTRVGPFGNDNNQGAPGTYFGIINVSGTTTRYINLECSSANAITLAGKLWAVRIA